MAHHERSATIAMRTSEILALIVYAALIAYFVSTQRKLTGKSEAALRFQQRLEEIRKAGGFSLSTNDHKKLNWLGISAGVFLCAITIFNALKR